MRRGSIVRALFAVVLGGVAFASIGMTPATTGAADGVSVQQRPQPAPAGSSFVPGEVVIQYRQGVADADRRAAKARVGAVARQRVSRPGRGDLELASLPPGLAVADATRALHADPAVAFAEPNFLYYPDEDANDPYYTNGSLWGLYGDGTTPSNVYGSQAGEAWARGSIGSRSVVVAVIDYGVDIGHPDLAANIWTNPNDPPDGKNNDGNCGYSYRVKTDASGNEYIDPDTNCDAGGYVDDVHGWDFVNDDNTVFDKGTPDETDGHGTHVAGTIGAVGGNGRGVVGVNWQVSIIPIKYLGSSTTFNLVKALDYLIDLKQRDGVNIVATNNSYGGSDYSKSVHAAIIRAANAGILFVAAAGNDGTDSDKTPRYPAGYTSLQPVVLNTGEVFQPAASYESVIAVAAIDSAGAKRSTSNWGRTTVDLGAPGTNIYSTMPGSAYDSKSGTSMAAPHVTGAAALYAAANPAKTARDIRDAIMASTECTDSLQGITVTAGRLNIDRLIANAFTPGSTACVTSAPGSTPTPTATTIPTPTPTASAIPAAPSNLAARAVSRSQIDLSWSDNSGNESGFRIERSTDGRTFSLLATVPANTTTYSNTGLKRNTLYYYRVRADGSAGSSAYSNVASTRTTK